MNKVIELQENKSYRKFIFSGEDFIFLTSKHKREIRITQGKTIQIVKTTPYVGLISLPSGTKIYIKPKMPIRNLFYVISYTHEILSFNYYDKKQITKISSPIEIYIVVILNWIELLQKKGLYRGYVKRREKTFQIRGKVYATGLVSVEPSLLCEYEDLSYNVLENQILKSILNYIKKRFKLNESSRINIRLSKYLTLFNEISEVGLSQNIFNKVKYNSLNYHYKTVIELAQLVFSKSYLYDEQGGFDFSGYLTNMNQVFQHFIYKILIKELPEFNIFHELVVDWLEPENKNTPTLRKRPDILIKEQLVIDTKYYANPLRDSKTFRDEHLNQIYTYMNIVKLNGLIIYPENKSILEKMNVYDTPNGYRLFILSFPINSRLDDFEKAIKEFVNKVKLCFTHKLD